MVLDKFLEFFLLALKLRERWRDVMVQNQRRWQVMNMVEQWQRGRCCVSILLLLIIIIIIIIKAIEQ